jgi:integrase
MKSGGPNPYWSAETSHSNQNIINNKLKALHNLPVNSLEAAEAITLILHKDIIGPKWLTKPIAARSMKYLCYGIFEHAYALKVLPTSIANPAGTVLDVLLAQRQPEGGHRVALYYPKIPALYARLEALGQPAHSNYSLWEAAYAIGKSTSTVKLAIKQGKLPSARFDPADPALARMIRYEHRVEPEHLFKVFTKVRDPIPGIRSVVWELIKFCVLTGPRPSEARNMLWTEYDEDQRLWIMPWKKTDQQRGTKAGKHIRQDMVIPLSDAANAIIQKMKYIQQRYKMEPRYVFANYPSRFVAQAIVGQPPSNVTVGEFLRYALPPDEQKVTMHGMRTSMRSWGEDQRRPDGLPMFAEKDLERAIGHIAGFGNTVVSRIYSRHSASILGLIPIFDLWAKFVTSGSLEADVIPIRTPKREYYHRGG